MATTLEDNRNGADLVEGSSQRRLSRSGSRQPASGESHGVLSRLRRRVSILPLLVGLLAMALSVLAISRLIAERDEVSTIWVAASEIEADQPLTAGSLRTVEITGGVRFEHLTVESVSRDQLVGDLIPRVDVAAGTPLSLGQFYETGQFVAVESGQLTVAVVATRSHLPVGLQEGDTVLLVGVPTGAPTAAVVEDWPGLDPLIHEGTVVGIVDHEPLSDVTITVAVPREIADDAAWLAAQNRLAIAHAR